MDEKLTKPSSKPLFEKPGDGLDLSLRSGLLGFPC